LKYEAFEHVILRKVLRGDPFFIKKQARDRMRKICGSGVRGDHHFPAPSKRSANWQQLKIQIK
jgi:hypothetical protein